MRSPYMRGRVATASHPLGEADARPTTTGTLRGSASMPQLTGDVARGNVERGNGARGDVARGDVARGLAPVSEAGHSALDKAPQSVLEAVDRPPWEPLPRHLPSRSGRTLVVDDCSGLQRKAAFPLTMVPPLLLEETKRNMLMAVAAKHNSQPSLPTLSTLDVQRKLPFSGTLSAGSSFADEPPNRQLNFSLY